MRYKAPAPIYVVLAITTVLLAFGIYLTAAQVSTNHHHLDALARATKVLCNRGFILIDLTDGALALIGQRLEEDVRNGNAAAVRADQRFLTSYLKNRQTLVLELTDPESPCATPSGS